VRFFHIAFDRALEWGDCGSGSFDIMTNGIHGHVVAACRATSVWEVTWVDGTAQC
jgi:hypothetical protein